MNIIKKKFLIDICIIILSFFCAYVLRFGLIDNDIYNPPIQYQIFLITYLISWVFVSKRFEIYSSKRFVRFKKETFDIIKVIALCLGIAMIPVFFLRKFPLSRKFLFYLPIIQLGYFFSFRLISRQKQKWFRRRGYDSRQILIVGRNDRAARLARHIEENPEYGFQILGFVDAPHVQNHDNHNNIPYDFKLIGTIDCLERILKENVVDEVYVTLPIKSFYQEIEEIVNVCDKVGIEAKITTDLFSIKMTKSHISYYGEMPFIELYSRPKMDFQLMIKRFMDVTISLFILILSLPLWVIIGMVIKLTSKGPVIFKQKRVGYNGRHFTCLKFRTMVDNAEDLMKDIVHLNELNGPVFKVKNDPRITKVGRFMRKTSLDELPQLINVIKGQMSLVGPRPPIPSEVEKYRWEDRKRLSMKSGITCLWQVSGRTEIPFEKWVELDRQYIDNWSLWLDLKILARTIAAVFRGTGAT